MALVRRGFRYTAADHALFEDQGYFTAPRFLSSSGLAVLRARVDAILAERHPSVHEEWVLGLHQVLPASDNWMWTLATDPRLLDMLEAHLGPNLVLFSTQLAVKPPGTGSTVPWHQDGERCRSVWICLDDVDDENGTLRVLPGWHKHGRLPYRRVQTQSDAQQFEFFHQYHLYASEVEAIARDTGVNLEETAIAHKLPAGALEIHHPSLPHASQPNRSDTRWRRNIILRYQPASEPLIGGNLLHWRDGSEFARKSFLVRGVHPRLRAAKEQATAQLGAALAASRLIGRSPLQAPCK